MLDAPFRWIALLLPTTYISEGLRAAYLPESAHLSLSSVAGGLAATTLLLSFAADLTFRRRLGHFIW